MSIGESDGHWLPLPNRRNGSPRPGNPGPVYLVWPEGHPYEKELGKWVYQITAVELLNDRTATENSSSDTPVGQTLFRQHCASCHQAGNITGGTMGPNLAEIATSQTAPSHGGLASHLLSLIPRPPLDRDGLILYIQNNSNRSRPNPQMPNFGDSLQQHELETLADFILDLNRSQVGR